MKNTLICIDRDGTLIYDSHYYLGSQLDWKSKIKFLKGIVPGIKNFRKKLPKAKIHMITNQPGVALKSLSLLTKKKAHEVCREILSLLEKKGAPLDGYELCPHPSPEYLNEKRELKFNKKFIYNCECMKPQAGMIKKTLRKEKFKKENTSIYMIGDRESDVHTAHNINGCGILVPFESRPQEAKNVKKLKHPETYIAKDFLDAVEFIIKREK